MSDFYRVLLPLLGLLLGVLPGAVRGEFIDVLDLPARHSPLAERAPLNDVARTGDNLVAVGQRGHILRSVDGGASWSTLDSGLQSSITAAAWDGSRRIHLFSQAGHVLRLLPQGRSLEVLPQSVMVPIAGADFAADDSLVLVGNRGARSQRLP